MFHETVHNAVTKVPTLVDAAQCFAKLSTVVGATRVVTQVTAARCFAKLSVRPFSGTFLLAPSPRRTSTSSSSTPPKAAFPHPPP